MAAEIDWEFAKLFHPMALSERRLVLKELGRDDVVHRDEEQFYTWLAERYRLGEGQVVDAAIRKVSNKGDERGIDAKLCHWLILCTEPTSRRRSRNKQAEIRASSRELLQRGGENAELLLKLAVNYPWLDIVVEQRLEDEACDANPSSSLPTVDSTPPISADLDAEVTLTRLSAAIDVLREHPNGELLGFAASLADAVYAHAASVTQARNDAIALAERREALSVKFARLSVHVANRIGGFAADELSIEAVEAIVLALDDLEECDTTLARAKESLSNVARSSDREERASAFEAVNYAEDAYSRSESRLAEIVAAAMLQTGEPFEEGLVDRPEMPSSAGEPNHTIAEPELDAEFQLEYDETPDDDDIGVEEEVAPETEEDTSIEPCNNDRSDVVEGDSADASTPDLSVEAADISPEDFPLETFDYTLSPDSVWDEWLNEAVKAGRFGLAVHLADARKLAGVEAKGHVTSVIYEALLRGNAVQAAYNRSWSAYEELKGPLLDDLQIDGPNSKSRDLLLLASAIRPAMLRSDTGLAILSAIGGDVAASVIPLRRAVEKVASLRLPAIASIAATLDLQERQRRAADIKDRLAKWRDTAPTRKMNYQPATAVWLDLLAPAGAIGRPVEIALAGKADALAQVRDMVNALEEDEDRSIDASHASLYKGMKRDAIEGIARKQLKALIQSATELLSEWIVINEEQGRSDDPNRSHRDALLAAIAQTRADIARDFEEQGTRVAALTFGAVLSSLDAQLRGAPVATPYPEESLDWEIALLPHFPLNARTSFRITADDVEDLAMAAAQIGEGGISSIDDAFSSAISLGAVSTAIRLSSRLSDTALESAPTLIEKASSNARSILKERRSMLRQSLDDLQIAVIASDKAVDELESAMTSFEQLQIDDLPLDIGMAGAIADFPLANRELDRIAHALDKIRSPHRDELERRIAALEAKHGVALADCRAQLDRGDLGTLAEEVDQIENHGPTEPADAAPLPLLNRFSQILTIASDKPAVQFGNLPKAAREGTKLGDFDFRHLPLYDRERAARLIETWNALRRSVDFRLKRNEKKEPALKTGEAAAELLEALGFAGARVTSAKREANWYSAAIATVPLNRREDCPVPALGSERVNDTDRRAHYPVVIAGHGDTDACIGSFDQLPSQVILLFTETLNTRQRRDLQKRARRSSRTIAVADSLTIATLATTKEAGTGQFFELAIPFGSAQPYAETGSETAIENFFGRENELRDLVAPRGPCFVYGGRQLGKTALLKQIELREKNNVDRVAVYCYIKPFGESEGADRVWTEISQRLQKRGVVLPRGGTLQDQLKAWVNQKPGRYLLIMLDEADAFLAGEMNTNFPIIEQMKALMEETGRAIKFVFAGLHNVQRFYRAPNSPLLHLGRPINVGPLLGSDRHAARQMALEPMAALGFEFENKIDAYHMLSLIGFYPSLMQIFGKDVVAAMNEELVKPASGEMPIMIKRELIDRCFNQQAFRESIVERLQNTLKLDERYELITYAVWTRMQDDSLGGRSTAFGYTASEISRLAREWWPAGFAETESLESFTAILDEMDGMGVLARRGDRYALRSQRIAAMLGGRGEIHARMQDLIDREPRRRPDPLASHRRIERQWSPLTLRQEAALDSKLGDSAGPRIILIGASTAAGLAKLGNAIETLAEGPNSKIPKLRRRRITDVAAIADLAARERREASPQAPRLLVVEGVWPTSENLEILRRDRVFRDLQRPVRLLIIGTPTAAPLALEAARDVLMIQVGPLSFDAVGHWMVREEYPEDERVQDELRKASGGWLEVLEGAKVASGGSKRTSEALIDAVKSRAEALQPADLGLDADSLDFSRGLFEHLGSEAADASDFVDYASMIAEDKGEQLLKLVEALGVVETVPEKGEVARRAFNPIAARLLG